MIAKDVSDWGAALVSTPPGYTWRSRVVTKGEGQARHHRGFWPVQGDVFQTGGQDRVIACWLLYGDATGALLVRRMDVGTTYLEGAVLTLDPSGFVMTGASPSVPERLVRSLASTR